MSAPSSKEFTSPFWTTLMEHETKVSQVLLAASILRAQPQNNGVQGSIARIYQIGQQCCIDTNQLNKEVDRQLREGEFKQKLA